ncbi:hypothetical protein D3C81_1380740 [compost metagenome]
MVGMPELIRVALKVPTPGTSSSSTTLPVGNIEPSPSAGSMNSITTSAAGKVTPSSSKSPVSCTSPLVIGTWAMMVLPMFFCQMRTVQMPFCGMREESTRPPAMAKAPTAAVRLPQLPDQSTNALLIAT